MDGDRGLARGVDRRNEVSWGKEMERDGNVGKRRIERKKRMERWVEKDGY